MALNFEPLEAVCHLPSPYGRLRDGFKFCLCPQLNHPAPVGHARSNALR